MSLQYNQWYVGKKILLEYFALFHVSLTSLLESHQLPMTFSSHKQPQFRGMLFLSVLRMMTPFSLWRENDRCSHNFSLSHQILWGYSHMWYTLITLARDCFQLDYVPTCVLAKCPLWSGCWTVVWYAQLLL